MISYEPFWKTMENRHMTSYTLIEQYGFYKATIQRLRKNQPVNVKTLDDLCQILSCPISDIVEIRLQPDVPLQRVTRKKEHLAKAASRAGGN